jgi:hypothetical protein
MAHGTGRLKEKHRRRQGARRQRRRREHWQRQAGPTHKTLAILISDRDIAGDHARSPPTRASLMKAIRREDLV